MVVAVGGTEWVEAILGAAVDRHQSIRRVLAHILHIPIHHLCRRTEWVRRNQLI